MLLSNQRTAAQELRPSDDHGRFLLRRGFCRLPHARKIPEGHDDVGAGLGVFFAKLLQLAEERGVQFNAIGIEPDPMAVEHLRSLNLFDVQQALFQAQSGFTDVNLVTFNKVVEHIPDPVPVLLAAAQAISPANGILYVEVPDVATIGNRAANDKILGALHHHL